MPQSLARLYIHLIFSTKNRRPVLTDAIRESLHSYLAGLLQNLDSPAVLINSVEDHIHILLNLNRTAAVSGTVQEIKTETSKWIKTQGARLTDFGWQNGYAAFSVSESNVSAVREYIAGQQEHHKRMSFQEEFRAILERHGIAFDERYVWD